ncbi:hypothetical protein BDW42DRAFT_174003 [Aspergillus taichungensis]|uniref:Uncharacterized protein n=1 Tax=Aspergillus taichungensis TaxID=482145 RepID=A0A2J5HP79_9EURO|nr:hypothetical protein BDW42DRAFT_174003 [Aspergillus taichungensis]
MSARGRRGGAVLRLRRRLLRRWRSRRLWGGSGSRRAERGRRRCGVGAPVGGWTLFFSSPLADLEKLSFRVPRYFFCVYVYVYICVCDACLVFVS